ncbi:DUF58 domain-containing protein [Candidatus Woesearchaeota archaeon]|nr:MAG: DUF58 domain-containing protein [Candidatus Woesearchaeota archaeon]
MAIDLEFLHQLDRLKLILKKKVHADYQGDRESRTFGSGLTFQDYREYVPGDDFRHIDWKVFARTDKLFIRRYEEERNLTVHILVDNSGSMGYGKTIPKFDYAAMLGLGFAYMALRNNEKFNLSTFSTKADPLRASRGSSQIVAMADVLSRMKIVGQSDLRSTMESYRRMVRSRSLIVFISDFLYPIEEVREVLQRYRKSELFLVQVLDPAERDLAVSGDVLLEDVESRQHLRTYISERMKKVYQDRLETHIFAIKDACEHVGASFVSVTTDTPIFETFYHILA